MMKQILNEWRTFLSEGRNPGIDDQLGVPKELKDGDGFFGRFDNATGVFQAVKGQKSSKTDKYKIKWQKYVDKQFPNIEKTLNRRIELATQKLTELKAEIEKNPNDKSLLKQQRKIERKKEDAIKTRSDWLGGYSYGAFKAIGKVEAAKLIQFKIQQYLHEAPEKDLEFMFSNLDRILEFAEETRVPHSQAPTGVCFYARTTDWWMFGDAFDKVTKPLLQAAKKKFIKSKGQGYSLPPATEPDPVDLSGNVSDERSKELADQAAFFNDFYEKNPQYLNPTIVKKDEEEEEEDPRNPK